jgi:DNA modification methylase
MNRLHYGDNLTLMQRMPLSCVDLIYLDPPFKSNQSYNLIYKSLTGPGAGASRRILRHMGDGRREGENRQDHAHTDA